MDLSKLARWLLPASLALNAFLAGMMTTHLLHDGPPRHGGPPPPERIVDEMARRLPTADGRILRDAMARRLPELEASWRDDREAPDRMRGILRSDPFDEAAFRRQLLAREAVGRMLAEVLPDAVAKMSPEGRRALADWGPPGSPPPPPPR